MGMSLTTIILGNKLFFLFCEPLKTETEETIWWA